MDGIMGNQTDPAPEQKNGKKYPRKTWVKKKKEKGKKGFGLKCH
jgi:hypothetical protein